MKILEILFNKKVIFFIIVFLFLAFLLPGSLQAGALDFGESYASGIGLGDTDPRVMIARIVQIILGFLGIIAVGLIIYGGFLWMTSNGNEEQISRAKKTLINAVIGLIIILASFGIVSFILASLRDATGIGSPGPGGPGGGTVGTGVLGNCSIEAVYPEDGQMDVPRNTSIMVTFKEEMNPSTICATAGDCDGDPIIADGRVSLYKASDDPLNYLTDVNVYNTADRRTFVFVPGNYLGSPSERIWYVMSLDNNIEMADGTPAFENCRNSTYVEWRFEVSNRLDLTPPQVRENGLFPPPDNARDEVVVNAVTERAQGSITVLSSPDIYAEASLISSTGPNIDTVLVDPNANEGGTLTIVVQADGLTAQLSRGATLLGSSAFSGRVVDFDGLFELSLTADPGAGNLWTIEITARVQPDTITVGNNVYTFVVAAAAPNQISRGATNNDTAANIVSVIDAHPDINAANVANIVEVEARVAGSQGNNIRLDSSNQSVLDTLAMTGGVDQDQNLVVRGRRDQPMNSVIQITFNEPILPMNVIGDAADVRDYIRIVNADPAARATGALCDFDAQCISFNCESNVCAGANDYLPGIFRISNMYKTVEFISDNQCGMNGCGEAIYCLPENSHLRVEMEAATLASCGGPAECANKGVYNDCVGGICKQDFGGNYADSRTRSYPAANIALMDGVMDAAFNSLDGDRNGYSEGPSAFYNDNPPIYSGDTRCQTDFEDIISIIINSRSNANNVLGEITGTYDSAANCAVPTAAACLSDQGAAYRAIGFADVRRDYDGNLFVLDENEDDPGASACLNDTITSVSCGSVDMPRYFCDEGDNFQWSFFINNQMETDPPAIINLSPGSGDNTDIASPIVIDFDKLMMSSSLKTGSTRSVGESGAETIHKNINLWAMAGLAPGYWITRENLDIDLDGEIDRTQASIDHSLFAESVTYRAQIGSGLKDIYQNCFKPSSGPGCAATETNPSCCGAPTATLDPEGNCP